MKNWGLFGKFIGGMAVLAFSTVASADTTITFEQDDDGAAIVNGQEILGGEFSDFNGLSISVTGSNRLAAFDTDPAGPNAGGNDGDLLVGLGNALIIQNNGLLTQTTSGIFDTPDDSVGGGTISFSYTSPVVMKSVDLIDVNGSGEIDVRLTDVNGRERFYDVPDHWTTDVANAPLGWQTLDLTTLANQPAEPGATGGDAVASQDPGFSANNVVLVEFIFEGSGAIDNVVFAEPIPAPGAALLAALGCGVVGFVRRRMN